MIKYLSVFCCVMSFSAYAQVGGKSSFEFLNTPNNARLAALGGVNTSLADRDINLFFSNPALISDSLAGFASASHNFYVADIGQSTFSYAHAFGRLGMIAMGVQHISYGTINGFDEFGIANGEFKSGETALVVSKQHSAGNFRVGLTLKGIFSTLAGYRASAVVADIGGLFIHPEHDFTVGLVIKNAGFVLSEYSETSETTVPFDVQAGITFKPEHMPVRFSLTAHNLATEGKIVYNDLNRGNEKPKSLDKVLRHFNFAAEILFHKNVNALIGYNYLIHQELKLEAAGGGGFTFGFAGRVKAFEFTLSRSAYMIGNAAYGVSVSADLNKVLKRS